jgi:hypothetical protein
MCAIAGPRFELHCHMDGDGRLQDFTFLSVIDYSLDGHPCQSRICHSSAYPPARQTCCPISLPCKLGVVFAGSAFMSAPGSDTSSSLRVCFRVCFRVQWCSTSSYHQQGALPAAAAMTTCRSSPSVWVRIELSGRQAAAARTGACVRLRGPSLVVGYLVGVLERRQRKLRR